MVTEPMQPEPASSPRSLAVTLLSSWQIPLLAASILPALAAALGAIRVINVFRLAEAGSGGIGAFSMGLYQANKPLVASLAAASVVLLLAATVQFTHAAQQLQPLKLFVCAVLAALGSLPSILLWIAESFSLSVVSDALAGKAADASAHLSRLLIATAALGLVIPPIAVVVTIFLSRVAHSRSSVQRGRLQATIWLLVAVILATMAGCFYVRSARLCDAAIAGSL